MILLEVRSVTFYINSGVFVIRVSLVEDYFISTPLQQKLIIFTLDLLPWNLSLNINRYNFLILTLFTKMSLYKHTLINTFFSYKRGSRGSHHFSNLKFRLYSNVITTTTSATPGLTPVMKNKIWRIFGH